jgi:hypothetical protein
MKPIKSLLVLAILCAPVIASAQGYYYSGRGAPDPLPGGFHNRVGHLTLGGSIGLGGMHDSGGDITCDNCDFQPLALELDGHIGGVLSPRFALMLELQGNFQTVHSDFFNGDTILSQTAAMVAGQFWLLPQLWIKGGLGVAGLQQSNDNLVIDFGTGGVVMGAIGVELLSARRFALELQGRIIEASYRSFGDNVTSGTIGIGVNWY